jgi:hypothetical protein
MVRIETLAATIAARLQARRLMAIPEGDTVPPLSGTKQVAVAGRWHGGEPRARLVHEGPLHGKLLPLRQISEHHIELRVACLSPLRLVVCACLLHDRLMVGEPQSPHTTDGLAQVLRGGPRRGESGICGVRRVWES